MRNRYVFCLFVILAVLLLVSLLQSTTRAKATSPPESNIPNSGVAQGDLICAQKPKIANGSSSDLPGSFVLGDQVDKLSPSEILKLQSSYANDSILEYTLVSYDDQSYEVIPLCNITPIQQNGSIIALVGNDPKNGDFMWLQEYGGVFPSLSQGEAFQVLHSNGYSAQNDPRLVFFDSEMYWVFNVTIGESVTNAFVSFSDQQIEYAADMLSRLIAIQAPQSDDHGMIGAGDASLYTWMVGNVPYFHQGQLPWCGIFSLKEVLWWYGIAVSEYDIANYLGVSTDDETTLDQEDQAFVHFMGMDNENSLDHTYGSGDIDLAKAWIYCAAPTICAIRAPGSGEGDDINHFVTLVGWDDNFGGGSWCLLDTAPHIQGPSGDGYDVWISYSSFDQYWDKVWYTTGISDYTRGMAAAIPGDYQYPSPSVAISGLTDIQDNQQLTLEVSLTNTGEGASTATDQSQGAFVRFDNAEIVSVEVKDQWGWFKSFKTFDEQGNEIPMTGAKIIEFYTDQLTSWYRFFYGITTVSAKVTIRPTAVGLLTVDYRGWLQDTTDRVRQHWTTIDDDRPGSLTTMLAEPCIVSYPSCYWSSNPPYPSWPTYSQTCTVTDDDPNPPAMWGFWSDGSIYDTYTGNYRLGLSAWDASDFSVKIHYAFGDGPWSPWYEYNFPGFGDNAGAEAIYQEIPRSQWIQHVGSTIYWQVWAEDYDADVPWDGAGAITGELVGGVILDDDTDPPWVYDAVSPEYIFDSDTGGYVLQVSASDSSGISSVYFAYQFGDGPYSDLKPFSEQSGDIYRYYIPRSEWINHVGESIRWYAQAWDNDSDRPNDALLGGGGIGQGYILDDDTEPPRFMDAGVSPSEGVNDSHLGSIRLHITIGYSVGKPPLAITHLGDPSGISIVQFWVFGSWRDATGSSDYTYWYDIPADEWKNHVGETWSWKVYAEDNDNDLPNDHAGAESSLYPGTNIWDDDTTGPTFSNPSSVYLQDKKVVRIQIDATDPSGIYAVEFRYRFEDGSWTGWHTPTWSYENTYRFDIPYDVWCAHGGQTIYWQARPEDADNDRVGDHAISESDEYSAIIPLFHEVGISVDPSKATVAPGLSTSFTLSVHNTGSTEDTYSLKLSGLDAAWYTFSATSPTVGAGQTVQVNLTVSQPYAPLILKVYPFMVTATSQGKPSVSAEAKGMVTVDFTPTLPPTPTGDLAIEVQPTTIYEPVGTKAPVSINILVLNNQNFDDAITVDITNGGIPTQYQANLNWFNWTQIRVFIPAGNNINIPLRITVPTKSTPIGTYLFTALVTSEANMATSADDSGTIELAQTQVLQITAQSPVNILVTDPNGLSVGYNPVSGAINDIPGAYYSGPGSEPQAIIIPDSAIGTYRIDAFGTGTGTYTVTIQSFASDGSLANSLVWSGTAEPSAQYTETVQMKADGSVGDITAPITTLSKAGTQGLNGWYVSDVTITLTATDDISGVAITQYSFDAVTWIMYTGPFTINTEETTSIYCNSTDKAGNVEGTKSEIIKIDKTPPTTILNPSSGYALQDGVTFVASATDSRSGVKSVTFSIREDNGSGGIPVGFEDIAATYDPATDNWTLWFDTVQLPDGYYVVLVKATDNAGNVNSITVPYSIRNWAALTITVVGNGCVSRDPDQAIYTRGTGVTLTATAAPGWTFVGWSGDLNSNTNSVVITMDGNKVITATFAVKTTTLLCSAPNPSAYGERVTFVALVLPMTWRSGMPTGTVTFKDAGATLGTANLNAWGVATFSTSSLSVGKHLITATYEGGVTFNGSTSSALGQKVKACTTVKVVSSTNPSVSGQSVTFTATVVASELGAGVPTGKVTFKDGCRTLGTGTLDAAGHATYSTSSLSVGAHCITAVYGGDDNYCCSVSSVLSQNVKRR